jgi:hypothetical protein
MLDGRIATLTLALCLALVAGSAQSQRRSQQVRIKQPETTVTQEKSHEDLRGTKQSPLIIEVAPTPKTDTERAEETKERERITELERNKEKSDSDIVRYTGELAFFTKGLFAATVALVLATIGLGVAAFFQSRDTKRAVVAAEQSATAAQHSMYLSIKEFSASHPPQFKIHFIRLIPTDKTHPDFPPLKAKFTISNIGTSDGTITRSAVQLAYLYPIDLPYLPDLPRNDMIEPDIRLYSGMSVTCTAIGDELSGSMHSGILGRIGKILYLAGWVAYRDRHDNPRTTYFCRQYEQERFTPVGDPDCEQTY